MSRGILLINRSFMQQLRFKKIFTTSCKSCFSNSKGILQKRCYSERVGSSVSEKEMLQFRQYVSRWWKPGGEYDALRSLNDLRVPMIKKLLTDKHAVKNRYRALEGFRILDVGCGGGILSEPLARLGGNVIGVDPLEESIDAAKQHASLDHELKDLEYKCSTVEEMQPEYRDSFDMVIASEVVEHIDDPQTFIYDCCALVKPGGLFLLTTINRTIASTLLAKYVAEYIFQLAPVNTHDENKFVTPEEVTGYLRKVNMQEINYHGMTINPLTLKWSWTNSLSINYLGYARKPNR